MADFVLESHHERLLTAAAELWDRATHARQVIDAEGTTYADRFGQPRERPEVAIERQSKIAFARLLRELALDVDEPAERATPPTIQGNANARRKG